MKELDRNSIKTQKDAEEKAYQRCINRLKDIKAIFKDLESEDNEIQEKAEDERNIFSLSIEKNYMVEIQLSTGGDADGFKLFFNQYKELIKGCFYWADWGQYAERYLDEEELNLVNDFFYAEGVLE